MASVITVDLGPGAEKAKETFEKYSSFVVGNAAKDIADSAMQRTAETAKAEIELIISTIEENVQAVVENGADALYKSLGINEETMQFAKNMVAIANNGLTLVGSKVLQGILLINKFDSMSIPMNVLAAGLQMIASFADLYYKAFIEAYGVYIDLIVEFIIDPGIALEILKDLIDVLLKQIYDLIDDQCYKYLGMTLAQLYYYCRKGMQLYKDYKEARKKLKEQQQQEEEEHREGITASGSKIKVELNADVIKDNLFNWLKL